MSFSPILEIQAHKSWTFPHGLRRRKSQPSTDQSLLVEDSWIANWLIFSLRCNLLGRKLPRAADCFDLLRFSEWSLKKPGFNLFHQGFKWKIFCPLTMFSFENHLLYSLCCSWKVWNFQTLLTVLTQTKNQAHPFPLLELISFLMASIQNLLHPREDGKYKESTLRLPLEMVWRGMLKGLSVFAFFRF